MKSARMATGAPTTRLLELEMPSRFVLEKVWTWAIPVALKVGGKPVMEKAGLEAEEVVAVKRDHRRVTVSVLAEAMVVPAAAVKAVT